MRTRAAAFVSAAVIALVTTTAGAADLLVHNINGYTLTQAGKLRRFEALLVRDGKVLATGSQKELTAKAKDATKLDSQGRVLLPGLTDAHGHIMNLGFSRTQADLVGTRSLAEALARVRTFADANPQAQWIRGRGWNQVIWGLNRFPTAAELDKVVWDRPVWLKRVDGHAGWANSAVLRLAGITRDTKAPEGGRIERDAQGNATGVLVDAAMDLVDSIVPKPTREEAEVALDTALRELAGVGLTSVHDAGIDAGTYALYTAYADAGKLTLRIDAMIGGAGEDFDAIVKQIEARSLASLGMTRASLGMTHDDFLSVRSVKLYADGALGSRGAALLEPYSDQPGNRGLLFQSDKDLSAQIDKALSHGYQVCIHAIGDAGNRQALDAFERVAPKGAPTGATAKNLRHRIEHAQVVSLADIPRFKQLGIIASMQPTHATSDMNMAETRVGPERIKGAYAWRRFKQAGARIAAGSDFPVESPNPFWGLHAAVTRQDQQNLPPGGWYPDQTLTVKEALRAFTLDAAYAGHQEKNLGTLTPGKQADFILVDRDIFSADPKTLWQTKVLETWVAGRRVYPDAIR